MLLKKTLSLAGALALAAAVVGAGAAPAFADDAAPTPPVGTVAGVDTPSTPPVTLDESAPAPAPVVNEVTAPVQAKFSTNAFTTLVADTVKPEVSLAATPSIFNSNNVDFVIMATDNVDLAKIVGNIRNASGTLVKPSQTAASGTSGTLTIDLAALTDGSYNLRYNALDAAGNISATKSFDFTVDDTAPTVTIKPGDVFSNGRSRSISFKLFDAKKIARSTLNGVAKAYSPNPWTDLNGVKPGMFGAVEGLNTLVVYDVAGNSTTVTFILDTTGPTATVKPESIGADGFFQSLSYKLYDPANVAKSFLNGVEKDYTLNPWTDLNGIKPGMFGAVEGLNTLILEDALGNQSTYTFVIDTIAPVIVTPADGEVVGGTHTWNISQIEANPAKAYMEIDQLVNGKWQKKAGVWVLNTNNLSSTFNTVGFDDSLATQIKISSWDKAGNQSSKTFSVVIDNTAPVVSWQLQPNANYGIGGGFHVRPISPEAGLTKSVYIDSVTPGNLVWSLTSAHKNFDTTNANNQALWDSLGDGSHVFITVFTDSVGNATTVASDSFVIDRTAPTVISETQVWDAAKNRTVVKLVFSEPVSGLPQGWNGSGTTYTKAYYNTKPSHVTFADVAGNTGSYWLTPVGAPAPAVVVTPPTTTPPVTPAVVVPTVTPTSTTPVASVKTIASSTLPFTGVSETGAMAIIIIVLLFLFAGIPMAVRGNKQYGRS